MDAIKILLVAFLMISSSYGEESTTTDQTPVTEPLETTTEYKNDLTNDTDVGIKNLSGNIRLTTLQEFTTLASLDFDSTINPTTDFDFNKSDEITTTEIVQWFDGITTEPSISATPSENPAEEVTLLSRRQVVAANGAADGQKSADGLMDVLVVTSGGDRTYDGDEKLIVVTPFKVIDEADVYEEKVAIVTAISEDLPTTTMSGNFDAVTSSDDFDSYFQQIDQDLMSTTPPIITDDVTTLLPEKSEATSEEREHYSTTVENLLMDDITTTNSLQTTTILSERDEINQELFTSSSKINIEDDFPTTTEKFETTTDNYYPDDEIIDEFLKNDSLSAFPTNEEFNIEIPSEDFTGITTTEPAISTTTTEFTLGDFITPQISSGMIEEIDFSISNDREGILPVTTSEITELDKNDTSQDKFLSNVVTEINIVEIFDGQRLVRTFPDNKINSSPVIFEGTNSKSDSDPIVSLNLVLETTPKSEEIIEDLSSFMEIDKEFLENYNEEIPITTADANLMNELDGLSVIDSWKIENLDENNIASESEMTEDKSSEPPTKIKTIFEILSSGEREEIAITEDKSEVKPVLEIPNTKKEDKSKDIFSEIERLLELPEEDNNTSELLTTTMVFPTTTEQVEFFPIRETTTSFETTESSETFSTTESNENIELETSTVIPNMDTNNTRQEITTNAAEAEKTTMQTEIPLETITRMESTITSNSITSSVRVELPSKELAIIESSNEIRNHEKPGIKNVEFEEKIEEKLVKTGAEDKFVKIVVPIFNKTKNPPEVFPETSMTLSPLSNIAAVFDFQEKLIETSSEDNFAEIMVPTSNESKIPPEVFPETSTTFSPLPTIAVSETDEKLVETSSANGFVEILVPTFNISKIPPEVFPETNMSFSHLSTIVAVSEFQDKLIKTNSEDNFAKIIVPTSNESKIPPEVFPETSMTISPLPTIAVSETEEKLVETSSRNDFVEILVPTFNKSKIPPEVFPETNMTFYPLSTIVAVSEFQEKITKTSSEDNFAKIIVPTSNGSKIPPEVFPETSMTFSPLPTISVSGTEEKLVQKGSTDNFTEIIVPTSNGSKIPPEVFPETSTTFSPSPTAAVSETEEKLVETSSANGFVEILVPTFNKSKIPPEVFPETNMSFSHLSTIVAVSEFQDKIVKTNSEDNFAKIIVPTSNGSKIPPEVFPETSMTLSRLPTIAVSGTEEKFVQKGSTDDYTEIIVPTSESKIPPEVFPETSMTFSPLSTTPVLETEDKFVEESSADDFAEVLVPNSNETKIPPEVFPENHRPIAVSEIEVSEKDKFSSKVVESGPNKEMEIATEEINYVIKTGHSATILPPTIAASEIGEAEKIAFSSEEDIDDKDVEISIAEINHILQMGDSATILPPKKKQNTVIPLSISPEFDEIFPEASDPFIIGKVQGKSVNFTVKIIDKDSSFFIPPDVYLTAPTPDTLNLTWRSINHNMNNSLAFDFKNSVQINLVKDDRMCTHTKFGAISSNGDQSQPKTIELGEDIQVILSNVDFLGSRQDEPDALPSAPNTSQRSSPTAFLVEILGGCLGCAVLIGLTLFYLVKIVKGREMRTFKPNEVP